MALVALLRAVQLMGITVVTLQPLAKLPQVAVAVVVLVRLELAAPVVAAGVLLPRVQTLVLRGHQAKALVAARV